MGGRKSGDFNKKGIEDLAQNKPVVHKILNSEGTNIYTGVAKRGRVEDRLKEHLPNGPAPIRGGKKVVIIQKNSIDEAIKSEQQIIERSQPRQNIKGK